MGRATLGRIMNVIGEPIDECGPIGKLTRLLQTLSSFPLRNLNETPETNSTLAIHREAPPFVDQSTEMEMLVTGIKVNSSS